MSGKLWRRQSRKTVTSTAVARNGSVAHVAHVVQVVTVVRRAKRETVVGNNLTLSRKEELEVIAACAPFSPATLKNLGTRTRKTKIKPSRLQPLQQVPLPVPLRAPLLVQPLVQPRLQPARQAPQPHQLQLVRVFQLLLSFRSWLMIHGFMFEKK